jgi:hypothetical protein
MKVLIVSIVSLLLGVVIGWYFEYRHGEREMTDVVEQMEQPIEASDRLQAATGIRAIELIEAGNTNQAIEMFSFPIASFYLEYRNLTHNDERTKKLLAKVEQFAQTNQVVAAQIKWEETNAGVR